MLNSNLSLLKELSGAKLSTSFINICDEIFPIAREVSKNKNGFENGIDLLLHLEKLTRNASHLESNTRVLIEIVNICVDLNRWVDLNNYLVLLANRRLVVKKSIKNMVNHCLVLIDTSTAKDFRLDLVKTLYGITEGKNYLEIERTKLAKLMADHYEQENDIDQAINVLEDLKCEIIANMDSREKIKLQLQLIRLLVVKHDYLKAQILSNKIATKFLEQPKQEDLKLNFYNLKITLDRKKNFLKTSKHYQAILNCYGEDDPMKLKIMGNSVLYCILAIYDNEQKDMMESLSRSDMVKEMPKFKDLLNCFLSKEIIEYDKFVHDFKPVLSRYDVLDQKTENAKNNWIEIRNRLLEHNVMVISNYYSRIYLIRMSEILKISIKECEELISKLVTTGLINAKIDRLTGIVNFIKSKQIDEILNDWSIDIGVLMDKVNIACHEVNKILCCAEQNEKPIIED